MKRQGRRASSARDDRIQKLAWGYVVSDKITR